jgi:hypothetical protein
MHDETVQRLSLCEAADLLLNECRMVLPGIQALFGFQLVAVFSERFERLSALDQQMHLWATALVVVAIAMIMTPAAYHRQAGSRRVTLMFVRVCTWLLVASMAPLAIAITLEFYIVADVLWQDGPVLALSLGMLLVFVGLWGVLPRILLARERAARAGREADALGRPSA